MAKEQRDSVIPSDTYGPDRMHVEPRRQDSSPTLEFGIALKCADFSP